MADLMPKLPSHKALVIDDEKIIADDLAHLICQRDGWTAKAFTNVSDALVTIENNDIDVCFLDIEMPGRNGLSVGRTLKDKHPKIKIIFVTAYPQYAVSAFRLEATDYLIKPVTRELLAEACHRIENYGKVLNSSAAIEKLENSQLLQSDMSARVKFQAGGRIDYIDPTTIVYAKAAGNYVEIVTTDRKYCIRAKFSEITSTLLQHNLERIHRSYVVNPSRVSSATVSAKSITRLYMENGENLPVSENYRVNVTAILTVMNPL